MNKKLLALICAVGLTVTYNTEDSRADYSDYDLYTIYVDNVVVA